MSFSAVWGQVMSACCNWADVLVHISLLTNMTMWLHGWRTYIGCDCQTASQWVRTTVSVWTCPVGRRTSINADWHLHRLHNWSRRARASLPLVTCATNSLRDCLHKLSSLNNVWCLTCSEIHLRNMTVWCEGSLCCLQCYIRCLLYLLTYCHLFVCLCLAYCLY